MKEFYNNLEPKFKPHDHIITNNYVSADCSALCLNDFKSQFQHTFVLQDATQQMLPLRIPHFLIKVFK